MDTPILLAPREVAADTDALTTHLDVPGAGKLPVNAFLIRAAEPVLVDTGIPPHARDFVEKLSSLTELEDLRWIWLTHADADHTGALYELLEVAPNARLVTTFMGMGKLNLSRPLPPERVHLLNPGQRLSVGDRELVALKPPSYDANETTALFDAKTRALFSADSFGALLPEPILDAAELPSGVLRDGLVTWTTIDAPWIHDVEEAALGRALDAIRALRPSAILSSHAPPARDRVDALLGYLAEARAAPRFVGPDQEALLKMAMAA